MTGSSSSLISGGTALLSVGSGGSVTSVFGRTGAVTAQTGDYSIAQIGGAGTAAAENLTAVIKDNGAGGLTIGNGQVTNAMLATPGIGGTIGTTQVACGDTTSNKIVGSDNFTYNGTTLSVVGDIFTPVVRVSDHVELTSASSYLRFTNSSHVVRWKIQNLGVGGDQDADWPEDYSGSGPNTFSISSGVISIVPFPGGSTPNLSTVLGAGPFAGGQDIYMGSGFGTGGGTLHLESGILDFGNAGGVNATLQKQGYNGIGLEGADGGSFYLNTNTLFANDGSNTGGGTIDMETGTVSNVGTLSFADSTTMSTAPSAAFTQSSSNTSAGGQISASTMAGSNNTIGGSLSGTNLNAGGNDNTLYGYGSGSEIGGGGTGTGNTFIGSLSGGTTTSGSYNIGLGYNALGANNSTGSYQIAIGANAYPFNTAFDNCWAIGKNALVNASNTAALGAASDPVSFGINMSTASAWLHLPAGTATAGTASCKFTPGVITSVAEDGTFEYNGAHFYATVGSVRGALQTSIAKSDLTTQGAAITATTVYAVPAGGAGLYRIDYVATITRAATISSILGGVAGFQIIFTDPNDSVVKTSNPTNITSSAGNTTATSVNGSLIANCKASTNLQYSMGYTSSGTTSMQYDLSIRVTPL